MNVIRKASLSRSNQIKKRRMVAYALVWLLGVLVLTQVFRFSADHEPRSNFLLCRTVWRLIESPPYPPHGSG